MAAPRRPLLSPQKGGTSEAGFSALSGDESGSFVDGEDSEDGVGAWDLGDETWVPLLCDRAKVDDHDASIVLVLPRAQKKDDAWVVEGRYGTIKLADEVHEPLQMARKIFKADSPDTIAAAFAAFQNRRYVPQRFYMSCVRARLLEILQLMGLKAVSEESIDGDEVLVKLSLDRKGGVLKRLAQTFRYKMPFTHEAYQPMLPEGGNYRGHEPMRNDEGIPVPAYQSYSEVLDPWMQRFREVDEIRLIQKRLLETLNIKELKEQGIMIRHFPAANHAAVRELNEKWVGTHTLGSRHLSLPRFIMPNQDHERLVREYFGELIGFFFYWFGCYIRHMFPLSIAAFICYILPRVLQTTADEMSLEHVLSNVFAVIMIVWASLFGIICKRGSSQNQQAWGMKNWDTDAAPPRAEYTTRLEGTTTLRNRKWFSVVCVILYCIFFAGVIALYEIVAQGWRHKGHMLFMAIQPYILSVMIKVASWVWGKIAFFLVSWENHRTEERFNHNLAWTLSTVKIFVALWPFLFTAFLRSWLDVKCGDDLAAVAVSVYGAGRNRWPPGIPNLAGKNVTVAVAQTPHALDWLNSYAGPRSTDYPQLLPFVTDHQMGAVCMSGCYPAWCKTSGNKTSCSTGCVEGMKEDLLTYYLFDVLSHFLMDLIIPILLTRWEVTKEVKKVAEQQKQQQQTNGDTSPGASKPSYSFLQFQAKCHLVASYEYDSWGGSYTQDFLALAIDFTLMAAFSQVQPLMTVIGLFCLMANYWILSFRMTNVTCRPWPLGAEGIGIWQDILDSASTCAITCNVALTVFLMEPVRSYGVLKKLMIFILADYILHCLRSLISGIVPSRPEDVRRIDDFNQEFGRQVFYQVTKSDHPNARPDLSEVHNYDDVDVSLRSRSAAAAAAQGSPLAASPTSLVE